MSAFSRGCLLRHQFSLKINTLNFLPPKSFQQPRFFSSASILRVVKKAQPIPSVKKYFQKNKPSYMKAKTSTVSPPPIYQTFASTLAEKLQPTLLYQAPSHTVFRVSSYSASLFCFSYATFSYWSNCLYAPPDLHKWVPIAFGGICAMMAAFGGWFLLGPAKLINTITAIPRTSSKVAGAVGKNIAKRTSPELQIEIELRKMFPIPFFPARKVYVKPEEFVLPMQLAPPVEKRKISGPDLWILHKQEEAEAQKRLEYERSHLLSAPFRHASKAFFELFKAIARTWTRDGFMKVQVRGGTYKLDVTDGWALDAGRALDRLATIKPKL